MADFRDVLREIEGKILPNGSVADHASVALNRLRRDELSRRLARLAPLMNYPVEVAV